MVRINIFLLILLLGCGDDIAPRAPNFVIEAFINANEPVSNIKIKGTSPIDSAAITSNPISNAEVTISSSNQSFGLNYNSTTGLYEYLGNGLVISSGERYVLNVRLGEREAIAETVVPESPSGVRLPDSLLVVPQLTLNFGLREEITELFFEERILLQWDSAPGQRYFVVIEERVNEIDSILPKFIPEEAQELLSSFRFISEPSETPRFEIIGVALETYGRHVAKVFTVNKEYADLFDNLEQDSRDLNEPPSNVMNAQGIFTGFASDSIFFEVRRK